MILGDVPRSGSRSARWCSRSLRPRIGRPDRRCSRSPRSLVAALALAGPRARHRPPRPARPRQAARVGCGARSGRSLLVVLPITIVHGHHVPGLVRAPRRRRRPRRVERRHAARGEHDRRDRRQLRRSRSSLIPLVGSPLAVAVLAADQRRDRRSPWSPRRRAGAGRGASPTAVGVGRRRSRSSSAPSRPGTVVEPNEAASSRRRRHDLREPTRTRSRRSRPARSRDARSCG